MIVIKVAVVEDEAVYVGQMKDALKKWGEDSKVMCQISVDVFNQGEEILRSSIEEYHIIFMDISLDGRLNGVETAEAIRKKGFDTPLAFLTAYKEYALTGYKVGAIDYIIKPVSSEQVDWCMKRILSSASGGSFILKDYDGITKIPYNDIFYFQSVSHYIEIVTKYGNYKQLLPLKKLRELLPFQFVQCHRTIVINIWKVKRVGSKDVIMADGTVLPVSRTYLEEVRKAYVNQYS